MCTTSSSLFTTSGNGITPSEANKVLEKANFLAERLENCIGEHDFISESFQHISGKKTGVSKKGEGENALHKIRAEVKALVKVKHLITQFNTALDMMQNERDAVENTSLSEFCEKRGLECPTLENFDVERPVEPVMDNTELSEEDVICDLDIKTRARMLTLNATAAAIGASIHPEGTFSKAREELMRAMTAPSELKPVGQMAVVTTTSPSVDLAKVDEVFFNLQARRRELEAEDNRIKTSIQQKVREDELRRIEEHNQALAVYATELAKYTELCNQFRVERKEPYLERFSELKVQLEEWRKSELKRLDNLLLVIPTELVETYKEVCSQ